MLRRNLISTKFGLRVNYKIRARVERVNNSLLERKVHLSSIFLLNM